MIHCICSALLWELKPFYRSERGQYHPWEPQEQINEPGQAKVLTHPSGHKGGWGNSHFCWGSSYKDSIKYKPGAPNSHLILSDNKGKTKKEWTLDSIRTPKSSYIRSQKFQ